MHAVDCLQRRILHPATAELMGLQFVSCALLKQARPPISVVVLRRASHACLTKLSGTFRPLVAARPASAIRLPGPGSVESGRVTRDRMLWPEAGRWATYLMLAQAFLHVSY